MSEFVNFNGKRTQVGVCESMYQLRWDQRDLVTRAGIDLWDKKVLEVIRFRFPFPSEDDILPGQFKDPFYGVPLGRMKLPEFEHRITQFRADGGYMINLPCPEEVKDTKNYTISYNGYPGTAHLVQQGWRDGRLVGIARCNGCRALFQLVDGFELEAADILRKHLPGKVADRLLAGYETTL